MKRNKWKCKTMKDMNNSTDIIYITDMNRYYNTANQKKDRYAIVAVDTSSIGVSKGVDESY